MERQWTQVTGVHKSSSGAGPPQKESYRGIDATPLAMDPCKGSSQPSPTPVMLSRRNARRTYMYHREPLEKEQARFLDEFQHQYHLSTSEHFRTGLGLFSRCSGLYITFTTFLVLPFSSLPPRTISNTLSISKVARENVTSYTSPRRGVTEFWFVNATEPEIETISHDIGVSLRQMLFSSQIHLTCTAQAEHVLQNEIVSRDCSIKIPGATFPMVHQPTAN